MIKFVIILILLNYQIHCQLILNQYNGNESDVYDDNLAMFHYLNIENSYNYNNMIIQNNIIDLYSYGFGINYYFNMIYGHETIEYIDKNANYTIKKNYFPTSGTSLPFLILGYKYNTIYDNGKELVSNDLKYRNTIQTCYSSYIISLNQSLFSFNEYGLYLLSIGYSFNNINDKSFIYNYAENLNKNDFSLTDYEDTDINYIKRKQLKLNNFNELSLGLIASYDIKFTDEFSILKKKNSSYFNAEYGYLRIKFKIEFNYMLTKPNEIFNDYNYTLGLGLSYPLPLFGIYKDL